MPPRKQQISLEQRIVTLTAIKVDGAKMTTSVFRQIPHKKIWDENYKLRGKIWGNVNYFWNGCQGNLHILWEMGDSLYRSLHSRPYREIIEQNYNLQPWNKLNLEVLADQAANSLNCAESALKSATKELERAKSDKFRSERSESEVAWIINETEKRIKLAQVEYEKKQVEEAEASEKALAVRHLADTEFEAWENAYERLLTLPQLYLA